MISTYTELQGAVANWLNRSDLTERIPEFIALAEADIRRRLRNYSAVETVGISVREYTLPADCRELRSITYRDGEYRQPINIGTPEIGAQFEMTTAGRPTHAFVVNNVVFFNATPAAEYMFELVYYANLTPLAEAGTNAVLSNSPDIYLFGALKEAEPFLVNDERAPLWEAKYEKAMAAEEVNRDNAEYGASLRPIRLPMVF